jgi:hypothetical protein
MSELRPCPLCQGKISFHQDNLDCPNGCHLLVCVHCQTSFNLGETVDPFNDCDDLISLRERIESFWNGCLAAK